MKPNYVAEAPYHPGYEDAVVAEPRPFLCGIYKSKPLSDKEIHELIVNKVTDYELCRAIEERHGIK
jgi:hypothetical protein